MTEPTAPAPVDPQTATVGVLGLGIMGLAYARNLIKAGWRVSGYDLSSTQTDALAAAGGTVAPSPSALGAAADVVLIALPSIPALKSAVSDADGLADGIRAGAIVAEMGTFPIDSKEAAQAALSAKGATLLDCPVSGTGSQAAAGDLSIYASGDEAAVDAIRPVFAGLSRETRYAGAFGNGMRLKYVANHLVTIHNLATAEALLLAERSGLDLQMTFDAIVSGAGTSRIFEVRGPMMIEGRYEPATMKNDVYQKDIDLIMQHAAALRSPVPLMATCLPYYSAALAEGRDKEDTAALFAVLQQMTAPKT